MLNLESRMELLGITVFQDSDRANQFYYLPGSPHISYEQGRPLFDLFAFRKGGDAEAAVSGGFLNMTVDIGIGGLKDRIEQRLKEQSGGDVTLAAVPFVKGSVRAIALGEDSKALQGGVENETAPNGSPLVAKGPRFIQNILGAGQPSLDGDNRAIFSFSLSEEGAAFFLGVLEGNVNARPVGVVYELDYVGLLPAYDLEITINFKSAYEYMRTRFTLGTLFFRADVDNIVEQLRRNESIKIRETARTLELSTPEAIRERQNRIDQLVKDLATGAMFQPSLTPGQPKARDETVTAADPTNTAPGSSMPAMEALRNGPSAAVVAGMGDVYRASLPAAGAASGGGTSGTAGGGTAGGGTAGGGTPATPSGQRPETAADVWNRLGRPQAAFALKNIRQEEERTVTYNLSQITAQKQTVAPQSFVQFLAGRSDLNQHVSVIDLNHPFFERLDINVNAASVDFEAEGTVQLTVLLRYGTRPDGSPKHSASAILRTREDNQNFSFFLDSNLARDYEYQLVVDYRSDFGMGVKDTRVEGPWTRTEATSLSVHPSWLGRTLPVTVQLAPNTPDDVTEVHARVRYRNAQRNIDDTQLVRLSSNKLNQTVHIRLADAGEQFEVAGTLFYADGTREELAPVMLPDPSTGNADEAVVINVPAANRLSADVIMLDPLGELQAVVVDAQVLQQEQLLDSRSFELATAGKREAWSVRLPQRDKPATLRYKERRIYKDGGLEAEDWREPSSRELVVGIPAEGTMTVAVSYLGPLPSSLSLSAILLDLEYSDPEGDPRFEQRTSLLITDEPDSRIQDWRVRLPDRTARTYRWRLTLLHEDGSESSTELTTDTRDKLILRPRF